MTFTSLPLMGIGNGRGAAGRELDIGDSLPLMGIGNRNCGRRDHVPLLLITPHGDRKRRRSACCAGRSAAHYPSWGSETRRHARNGVAITTDSLPLMGIGNPSSAPSPRRGRAAHYPSWGSETRSIPRRASRIIRAHYPSWGSETCGSRGRRRAARATHYPSWGSETVHTGTVHAIATISLPLMGIGNAWMHRSRYSGSLCSLPLMGIGNPLAALTVDATAAAHYPSWGSETSPLCTSLPCAMSSLPLMGIGNIRGAATRPLQP